MDFEYKTLNLLTFLNSISFAQSFCILIMTLCLTRHLVDEVVLPSIPCLLDQYASVELSGCHLGQDEEWRRRAALLRAHPFVGTWSRDTVATNSCSGTLLDGPTVHDPDQKVPRSGSKSAPSKL